MTRSLSTQESTVPRTMGCIMLCLAAAALVAAPAVHAQGASADSALVARGKNLFATRTCAGCHKFGTKMVGPDLTGVDKRRSHEWLVRFLKNTSQMLTSDSTAIALLKQWKGSRMPQPKLDDQEIDAVLAYVASAGAKPKK